MIEKELFSHYSIDEKKLMAYGFQPEGHTLVYTQELAAENFRIIITYDRALSGKIIDLAFGEEYVNFRMESATGYSAEIRNKFEALLLDIRDKCCKNQYFQSEQARRINEFIYETYDVMPEFLWPNIPSYAAFRKKQGGKWFAVIGSVPRRKVDPISLSGEDVEVINVKVDSGMIADILSQKGYYPAFHMNKKCWVSIILEDALSDEEIQNRIRFSFETV